MWTILIFLIVSTLCILCVMLYLCIEDNKGIKTIYFLLFLGIIAFSLTLSQNDKEFKSIGVKEYLENPSTYQVDSISVNGVFDHIEVMKVNESK